MTLKRNVRLLQLPSRSRKNTTTERHRPLTLMGLTERCAEKANDSGAIVKVRLVNPGVSPADSTLQKQSKVFFGQGETIMQNQEFAGAFKTNTSFLSPLERRLAPVVLPRIPAWLETHHLTMLTLVWSLLIVGFSYLAAKNMRWLWLVSVMILLQYITDYYDGKIGKYRNTGLVRWGYYMDHLLDYFFLSSVIIGYALILPEKSRLQLLLMLTLFGAYDMSTFLAFAATDRLKISYLKFGPTEFGWP